MNDQAAVNSNDATVDQHKEWLVTEGDRIGAFAKKITDWKHQVRIIWEASRVENEPLVVLNLLRYQAARNQDKWRNPDVYEELRKAIEECRRKANEDSELAMALILHLLAYTYRAYTFHDEERKRRRRATS